MRWNSENLISKQRFPHLIYHSSLGDSEFNHNDLRDYLLRSGQRHGCKHMSTSILEANTMCTFLACSETNDKEQIDTDVEGMEELIRQIQVKLINFDQA